MDKIMPSFDNLQRDGWWPAGAGASRLSYVSYVIEPKVAPLVAASNSYVHLNWK